MSYNWEALAAHTNGEFDASQFEAAAYRLVTDQVIYQGDRPKVLYALIEQFEKHFSEALSVLGVRVTVNRVLRYACAIPAHTKVTPASQSHTLMALVLRKIYDEGVPAGRLTDDGEVILDAVEFEERYKHETQRELPGKGDLDAAIKQMKRWGIARKADEIIVDDIVDSGSDAYFIAIRPAIVDVLGETALRRLIEWKQEGTPDKVTGTEIVEDTE